MIVLLPILVFAAVCIGAFLRFQLRESKLDQVRDQAYQEDPFFNARVRVKLKAWFGFGALKGPCELNIRPHWVQVSLAPPFRGKILGDRVSISYRRQFCERR